jgi:hypothetical protein
MPDVDALPPFEAYKGIEPYIFVSYAHKDGKMVFPDIKYLHDQGFRIWYDEGIDPGNEWPEDVANSLANASVFIVFISPNAVNSRNVRNEINFALNYKKQFIAIHIIETQLPVGLELRMGDIQAILKYRMDQKYYLQRMLSVMGVHMHASDTVSRRASPVDISQKETTKYERQKTSKPEETEADEKRFKLNDFTHRLRNRKIAVSKKNYKAIFRLNDEGKPFTYTENEFKDNRNGTVTDQVTGLMWQNSGSNRSLTYDEAKAYIKQRNLEQFVGYRDWRLPTIEELISLLEPEPPHIDPMFDMRQDICWSNDFIRFSNEVWGVHFRNGIVYWLNIRNIYGILAVRTL